MIASTANAALAARAAAELAQRPRPVRLEGAIQRYAWGGSRFIPELIGIETRPDLPAAELWLGAHPTAPATTHVGEHRIELDDLIAASPEAFLGPSVSARFDRTLPYLLKVLDVARMLSIQAHPTSAQAVEGFERDNRRGLAATAADRNYRDSRHKPEMQVALTDFWMLHGFRPVEELEAALGAVAELADITRQLRVAGGAADADRLRRVYQHVMTLPQDVVDRMLSPLAARLAPRYRAGRFDRSTPEFWAARAFEQFPLPDGHVDRGIVSIFLMNLVHLEPGQAIFIGAGVLHAHLEGVAVELMANSDNVLRGGLTPKHVDVVELLRIISVDSAPPAFLVPVRVSTTEIVFRAPADEFQLSRVRVTADQPHWAGPVQGADTLLVVEGSGRARVAEQGVPLARGSSVIIPHGAVYAVETDGEVVAFKASVPAAPRANAES